MMKMYSKEILGYLYDPEKKYFHVVVELKNEKGALANLCATFAEANVNLLNGFISVSPEGKSGIFSTFAEAESPSVTAADIQGVVDSCKFTKRSIIKESTNGLLVDTFHFPLRMTPGSDSILMSVNVLSHMFKELRESFGSGGSVILYNEGLAVGKSWMESISLPTGRKNALKHLNELFQIYHACGWGMIEVTTSSSDLNDARIRVWNSFECSGHSAVRPYSQFLRGMINGSCRAISDITTQCDEMKCIAVGDRYCEFWVHGPELDEGSTRTKQD
jgi:predicted hydrocarbon binding protein